jgi:hypothetical protein
VVKIPSLSRRAATAPTQDTNRDGRVDERDEAPVTSTGAVATDSDQTTRPSRAADAPAVAEPATRTDVRTASERKAAARAATATPATTAPVINDRPVTDPDTTRTPERDRTPDVEARPTVVPAGPRPRASMFATLGLIFGVAAALFVLSGTLAGYGIALGAIALVLSLGGISATGRRHVAGKTDALIGLLLGLGAILVGVLAMTGNFTWPTTDADVVERFRQWLDTQFIDRF